MVHCGHLGGSEYPTQYRYFQMTYELKPHCIELLVVHCSDSPPDRGDTAADINRWHLERGFDLIGYHKVILPDGTVENGRPEYVAGAHCKGHNTDSLSVCLLGISNFTTPQLDALVGVLRTWQSKYPDAKVVGHGELDGTKPCPNFDVRKFANAWGIK